MSKNSRRKKASTRDEIFFTRFELKDESFRIQITKNFISSYTRSHFRLSSALLSVFSLDYYLCLN